MKVKHSFKFVLWGASALLLSATLFFPLNSSILPTGSGVVFAQTGAPPAPTPVTEVDNSTPRTQPPAISPGVSVVQVITVPALPERVAPLTNELNSTIVRVPSDNRPQVIGVVDFLLSDGSLAVLNVPGKPDAAQLVRVAELPLVDIPAPMPAYADPNIAYVFKVDLFNCVQGCDAVGDAVHQHNPPLQLLIQPPVKSDPSSLALLHFDQRSGEYQVLLGTLRPDGYLQFPLVQTSKFVFTKITDWDMAQESILYPVLVPSGLPRTGDGSLSTRNGVPYGVFAWVGLAILLASGVFVWRSKRVHS